MLSRNVQEVSRAVTYLKTTLDQRLAPAEAEFLVTLRCELCEGRPFLSLVARC